MIALLALLLAAGPRQHLGPPVPKEVRRVVSLAPSLSEIVLAAGGRAKLVGVTRFDDDPRVASVPRIGGYNDPQPEAVLAVKPDLVLAEPAPANRGPVETLARLGVPVEAFPLATVAEIEDAIVAIAGILAAPERGREIRDEMERARARARERSAGQGQQVRALLVFGLDPLVVAGRRGFAGELLADAGGDNVASGSDAAFFRLSAEAAVTAQPEVIVLCGVDPPPGRAPIPGLTRTRVAVLRSTALLHPGPRIGEALDDLATALRR